LAFACILVAAPAQAEEGWVSRIFPDASASYRRYLHRMRLKRQREAQQHAIQVREAREVREWREPERHVRRDIPIREARRDATRVYAYQRRLAEEQEGDCIGKETHATSVLADTEKGALASAKMNWGAMVRSDLGERYMDIEIAAEIRHRCYRASTNETFLGKGAEVLGQYQWRCEIKARACKPGWTFVEKETGR
jgi:hypothetical protein